MTNPIRPACIITAALAAASMLAAGSAEARQKKWTQMNSCSCACRQDDGGDTVYIANKDFYSVASCGSYSGTQCNVSVSTSEGTRTVAGTWEGCIDHGKVWVRLRQTLSDDLPKLTVEPGAVEPPPTKPIRGTVAPDRPSTADPDAGDPPPSDRKPPEGAAAETLERSPD